MAKPLGPKSLLIRDAIKAHPNKGNKEIAELINDSHDRMDDKIKVTPQDIAQQKQAMKKAGESPAPSAAGNGGGKKGARRAGGHSGEHRPTTPPRTAAAMSPSANPVDLIDKTLDLAQQCGGLAALKRLVDRLAGMQ